MDMIKVDNVSYFYENSNALPVIHNLSFTVKKGEFVSIIGPSGCGKSTLLRIIAGLINANTGHVSYKGRAIEKPISEISFVFQDFALLPWLTNEENMKLGLSRTNISEHAKEKRIQEWVDKVGLSGFEDFYPNAISGGMKQRVGIVRAIVSQPIVLLMDEPFSALDELTANELRNEILYMLREKNISVDSVIMVTHNVEEAVELSDKVIVLSAKPSHVKATVKIKLPQPRNRFSSEFSEYVTKLYNLLIS